jgi:hypothetical protein
MKNATVQIFSRPRFEFLHALAIAEPLLPSCLHSAQSQSLTVSLNGISLRRIPLVGLAQAHIILPQLRQIP